jgi:hypothetical protein
MFVYMATISLEFVVTNVFAELWVEWCTEEQA